MNDWRARLRAFFQERENERTDERAPGEQQVTGDFIQGTVLPAFDALKEELEGYGRGVLVQQQEKQASITVLYQGKEEFSYLIRVRVFHKMSFAFPEIAEEGEDTPSYTAEVVVHGELQEKWDLGDFTEERIISDFLDQYTKWSGW